MEGKNGRQTGFVNNLVDTFGRAIAWGIMLIAVISIVSAIGIVMVRSKIKSAIDYMMASAVDYGKCAVLNDPKLTQKVRENIKEAVEYSSKKVKQELLWDEAFNWKIRENAKEAIEYALNKVKDEALNDVALNQKIKTNTKEAVEYLMDKAKQEAVQDEIFREKVKTNVKEGIEYTVHQIDKHF